MDHNPLDSIGEIKKQLSSLEERLSKLEQTNNESRRIFQKLSPTEESDGLFLEQKNSVQSNQHV